jgi:dTDP-4-dehydrorhamnose 3,5-epimerase
MRFLETPITGAWLVEPEARSDERGFFAKLWTAERLAARGLRSDFVECNESGSVRRGTLRGLHYQAAPHGEVKLVRCVRGRIFDAIVDLRSDSPTYLKWFGTELTADNRRMVYVPEGCAHGYLTLEDGCEVMYPVTAPYRPESERGLRWNDPLIAITWPAEPTVLSPKDREWQDYRA